MNTPTDDQLRELIEMRKKATQGPWCKDWCYSAIRHVVRNCEVECIREGEHECNSFDKYDGPFIAAAVNAIPAMPEELLKLREENTRLRKALEVIASWGEAAMSNAATLHWDMRGIARAALAAPEAR